MLITYLDGTTLKITLTAHEIEEIFGSYEQIDYADESARQKIEKIIKFASKDKGQTFLSKRLYIEAMPNILGGCTMYCTAVPETKEETKPHRTDDISSAYEFQSADSLLDAVTFLRELPETKGNFKVYGCKNKYIIITTAALSDSAIEPMKEFSSRKRQISVTQEAYIKEHCRHLL